MTSRSKCISHYEYYGRLSMRKQKVCRAEMLSCFLSRPIRWSERVFQQHNFQNAVVRQNFSLNSHYSKAVAEETTTAEGAVLSVLG